MKESSEERMRQMMLHKEALQLRREQGRQTVERIMRANEYKKQQILNKIQKDEERCESLRRQKMELLQTRRNARDEAGRLKESIQHKFEIIQRKGELDVSFVLLLKSIAENDVAIRNYRRSFLLNCEFPSVNDFRAEVAQEPK
jgi:hypothetical protein